VDCIEKTSLRTWEGVVMARLWNVGKDGTVFINCLKPAKNLLLAAKHAPPHVKAGAFVIAGALAVGGIGYYVCKKTLSRKKT
jgi:hypothetical protein